MAHTTLSSIESDDIRVFLVWEPIWGEGIEERARAAAHDIDDRRISQFWTPGLELGEAFTDPLKWGNGAREHAGGAVPWDVYMLYPRGAEWTEGAPVPAHWASPVVREEHLVAKIREMIAANGT